MMRRLFAALYEKVNRGSEDAGMREQRRRLLSQAQGQTIEIGAGTGLNVPHYPEAVTRLVLSEPDRQMRARLGKRAAEGHGRAEVVDAPGERLPFEDASFDTAVVTLVLCSVDDQRAVLNELARVVKPGGRLLFLEHVRSGDANVAKWQDRIRPVSKTLVGCNPNRDTLAAIERSAFTVESVEHGEIPRAPTFERPMIVGSARR